MKKILFIDDDEQIRRAYTEILQRFGFDVITISDGLYVKSEMDKNDFDLIVTDIVMPEKEGLETIKEIRTKDKKVPILAISGGGRIAPENHLVLAKLLGANDTLVKPFESSVLIAKINYLLKNCA
jgi:DNA-binding response OmpR family regulator